MNSRSHIARRNLAIAAAAGASAMSLALGCQRWAASPTGAQPLFAAPGAPGVAGASPPLFDPTGQPSFTSPEALADAAPPSVVRVPVLDRQWAWEQLVDTVDDYFRIESESPVQLIGDVITEGRIDTFPQIGATILEPHRPDSVGRYNRWESTFQTIRRRATLRVIPEANGYLVDAVIIKELEDLPRPEGSLAGAATFRNDDSLRTGRLGDVNPTRLSDTWIVLGRDVELEQALLAEIHMRVSNTRPPPLLQKDAARLGVR